jgi:hypothetical protein
MGPIGVRAYSVTSGLDGIDYSVDWFDLDGDGNVRPKISVTRTFRESGQPGGSYVALGQARIRRFDPPRYNPHGYRLQVIIKPQPNRNDASLGVDLWIYVPQGDKLTYRGQL